MSMSHHGLASRYRIEKEGLIEEICKQQQDEVLNRLLKGSKKLRQLNQDPLKSQIYLDWAEYKPPKNRRVNTEMDINHSRSKRLYRLNNLRKQELLKNKPNENTQDLSVRRRNYSQSVQLPKLSKNITHNRQKPTVKLTSKGTGRYKSAFTSNKESIQPINESKSRKNIRRKANKSKEKHQIDFSRSIQRVRPIKFHPNSTKTKIVNRSNQIPESSPIKKDWLQVDILLMDTYFAKMHKTTKGGGLGQNIQKSDLNQIDFNHLFIEKKQEIPNFIRSYKPVNPGIMVDDLFQHKNFTMVYDDKSQQASLYFGCYEGQKKCGLGIFANKNLRFEGKWKNNEKVQGYEITSQGIFVGKFKKNKRNGKGTFCWKNGEEYEGEWSLGVKHGSGMWKSGKGDSYIGTWLNGKVHGHGVHLTHTGQRYEGDFENFLKHGIGIETFPNGDRYQGIYRNGKPHGKGKYTWKNGIYYIGEFFQGYRQGKGSMIAKGYVKFKGNFQKQRPLGYGELSYQNGDEYKGQFEKGLKHGKGIMNLKKEQKILDGCWSKNQFKFNE